MRAPCKDCEQRTPSCHGECIFYLAYAEERQKEREARLNEMGLKGMTVDHKTRTVNYRKAHALTRRRNNSRERD